MIHSKICFHRCRLGLIVLFTFAYVVNAHSNEALSRYWLSSTAHTLPAGRLETGLFQPLRYGWSESVEVSSHPLVNILMPNLSLKWSHAQICGLFFTTQHKIYYPTPLLRTLSRKGTGGLISPEFTIPHMISLYNGILLSKQLTERLLFTHKTGVSIALKNGSLDERTTIDLPLAFPRLAVYYNGYGFIVGDDLHIKISSKWLCLIDGDIFFYPGAQDNFAFEHKGLFLWNKSDRIQFSIGYKLVYGEYPFGKQWHCWGLFLIFNGRGN